MSIIERVAELLTPTARQERDPGSPRKDSDFPDFDAVERAAAESTHLAEAPGPAGAASRPDAGRAVSRDRSRVAVPSTLKTRILRVDPERLRQQGLILPEDKRTPTAEAFRRVKRRILFNVENPKPDTRPNLVMVTSSLPGEGKSFCAANLALSIALERDYTALLVDGDVARPSLPQTLGVETDKGLMDVLLDRQVHLSDVLCRTDIDQLMLLPAGTQHRHATEVLSSGMMRGLLKSLSEDDPNRIIIFDSPPIMVASEASVLASQMGQIVVVVEAAKTPETALKAALARIESSNVVGLLLNKGERASLLDGYGEYGYDDA